MARDHEGYGKYGDPDLTGTTLTLYGKHHKTVRSKSRSGSPMPSENARSVTSPHDCLPTVKEILTSTYSVSCRMSPNERGQNYTPNCHKLRKTGASRRYLVGVPLPTLMLELGHESLAVTQDYVADVRKPGEAKKSVADADFVPKPNVVKTGTDGD